MSDKRAEILEQYFPTPEDSEELFHIYNAMDAYMQQTCLELLEYMARSGVSCSLTSKREALFLYQGEWISKEALFQNFL